MNKTCRGKITSHLVPSSFLWFFTGNKSAMDSSITWKFCISIFHHAYACCYIFAQVRLFCSFSPFYAHFFSMWLSVVAKNLFRQIQSKSLNWLFFFFFSNHQNFSSLSISNWPANFIGFWHWRLQKWLGNWLDVNAFRSFLDIWIAINCQTNTSCVNKVLKHHLWCSQRHKRVLKRG